MEVVKRFEGSQNEIEDDTTAYERLLNKMFIIDDNLPLKTEITNPLEMSRVFLIADIIKQEGNNHPISKDKGLLDEEANLLRSFAKYIQVHYISKERKGRFEAFESIKSYNLGQIQDSLDDKENEKFKRIMKKMG